MEQQKMPQSCGTRMSSMRLWIVELIQRRRCDRSTLKLSGTTVLHTARGTCEASAWSGSDLHLEGADSFDAAFRPRSRNTFRLSRDWRGSGPCSHHILAPLPGTCRSNQEDRSHHQRWIQRPCRDGVKCSIQTPTL
ncbi:hypothetical protein BC937DRAFT_89759 [Endogone sp. FLAS-F59071]|nr:hypothetical protein BC937DRAFT_89759 [Endogone sp. FLAS-F59071]|eukprot:RUS17595.1 hypothetical protein BC937DRAFT_89759 [Endogone sp. FLAS-F59071]